MAVRGKVVRFARRCIQSRVGRACGTAVTRSERSWGRRRCVCACVTSSVRVAVSCWRWSVESGDGVACARSEVCVPAMWRERATVLPCELYSRARQKSRREGNHTARAASATSTTRTRRATGPGRRHVRLCGAATLWTSSGRRQRGRGRATSIERAALSSARAGCIGKMSAWLEGVLSGGRAQNGDFASMQLAALRRTRSRPL